MYRIKKSQINSLIAIPFLCTLFSVQAVAKDWLVETPKAYKDVVPKLEPGDKVILANGTWNNFEIVFKGNGTKEQPLILTAETKGKVILSGQSNLRLAGEYLEVSGLVFKNGYTPTRSVISYQLNKKEFANNSRVTEVVIDEYSNPDRFEPDYWVALYGKNNRFDHNYLAGKRNKGVTMAVRLPTEADRENNHRIDHNYFGPRPVFGSNGGETLRIGTSHYSLSDSLTVVENNYFDRCDGEVEIISVKSGKNILRNNTFFESKGTLTLRHGNGNIVENNVFFGNGVDHTGGIRVINRDQIVRNNYLEGLTGYRFGSGFTVMNGVPNSRINRYHQVVNAKIENNSFINVEHIHLAAGSDQERSATPQESSMSNNLVFNENLKDAFSLFDDVSGISFAGNIRNEVPNAKITDGFNNQSIQLVRAKNGLLYPEGLNSNVGVNKNLMPTEKAQVGPTWYAKVEPVIEFSSNATTVITAGENSIFNAVAAAESGDKLVLAPGEYHETKILKLSKVISLIAQQPDTVTITFARSTFVEIANGGSLKLADLVISGKEAPDSKGNVLIRPSKWGMYKNYRLVMSNITIEALDINNSFHVFDAGSRSLATYIKVTGSTFKNISGDIFRLHKETDDLGIFNDDYLIMDNNVFENIAGVIVDLYRGGRDESTFGPHLSFINNTVTNAGHDTRNKTMSVIKLHGVQVTAINNNRFNNTAPIMLEHTVGEPISIISGNQFIKTAAPSVVELYAQGPHTAILQNNKQSK
jgi:poly(beta-D-mannuronate) lyase